MPHSLDRAGILSLVALTLHYSCFAIVLHVSRTTPGTRYSASSAIFLTEVVKILASIGLVAATGELHDAAMQRKRLGEERRLEALAAADREASEERRVQAVEEEKRLWARIQKGEEASLIVAADETAIPVQLHRRASSSVTKLPQLGPKIPKNNTLSIDVALAQGKAPSARAPSFALIPATPAPIPSPTLTPDVAALHPDRVTADPAVIATSGSRPLWSDLGEGEWWQALLAGLFTKDLWHLAALAGLFCFQGNAQFVASGNLSVPVFLLAYQLKIPATAMFSIYLLDRVLSRQQWFSLLVLSVGVGLVQLSNTDSDPLAMPRLHDGSMPSQALGFAAVIAACLSSGFASVSFERVLKARAQPLTFSGSDEVPSRSYDSSDRLTAQQTPLLSTHTNSAAPSKSGSVWMRNIQLSAFGLLVSLPFILWDVGSDYGPLDYEVIEPALPELRYARTIFDRFFDGFDRPLPWLVVILQSVGGLLNALVMRHADNLLKCYAVSVSIVLSFAASVVLFEYKVSTGVFLSCVLVLVSTWTYARSHR